MAIKTKNRIFSFILAAVCALGCAFGLTACKSKSTKPTEGLEYTLNADRQSYSVTGTGSASAHDIVIAPTFNGLPVTEIGDRAFSGEWELTSVTIPDSVTSIGADAFAGCYNIHSITIPPSVTSIGARAFETCTLLTSVTMSDSVTSIGERAFSFCDDLESIVLSSSLTSIKIGLFERCDNLTSVTIPDSVTSIGYNAFYGCNKLQFNEYGNAMYLGSSDNPYAALIKASNRSVTSVEISDSVACIAQDAFYNCDRLEYNEYGNAVYLGNSDNPYLVLMKARNMSIEACSTHEKTKIICDEAFYNCSLMKDITISASVTNIGYHAFYDCNLNTIDVAPENSAYQSSGNCLIETASKTLILGSNNSMIPLDGSVEVIGDQAFKECYKLKSVTLPDTLKKIGDSAFWHCSGLTSLVIPDSVASIGGHAFEYCSGLISLTVLGTRASIGNYAFRGCSRLEIVALNNSVTSIGSNAFADCDGLTSIRIPASVTSIGKDAFSHNLTSITVVKGNKAYHSVDNCIIGTSSGNLIFGCNSSEIRLDESVKSIGASAFYGCDKLTSIEIPDTVTNIGNAAFSGCSSLESIVIPDSVTTVGSYAFENCGSLKSITAYTSLTYIGDLAFYNCGELTNIDYNGTMAQWKAVKKYNVWNNNTGFYTVHCTDGNLSRRDVQISWRG